METCSKAREITRLNGHHRRDQLFCSKSTLHIGRFRVYQTREIQGMYRRGEGTDGRDDRRLRRDQKSESVVHIRDWVR